MRKEAAHTGGAERSDASREGKKNPIPCTSCGYCRAGCPMGPDIPVLMSAYKEARFPPSTTPVMRIKCLKDDGKPKVCIGCGNCEQICPQKIGIREMMRGFTGMLEAIPTQMEICRRRNAEQKN